LAVENGEWIAFENGLLESLLVKVVFDDSTDGLEQQQMVGMIRN